MTSPTLVDVCCRVLVGQLLRGNVPDHFPEFIPEPELLLRIYDLYQARYQAVPRSHAALLQHLLVLQAFAEEWQVRQLRLCLHQPRSCRALSQLHLVASQLRHLEVLGAAWMTDLTFLQVPPPDPPPPPPPPGQAPLPGPLPPLHTDPSAARSGAGRPGGDPGSWGQQAGALQLTCLALRGCRELPPAALGPGLLGLAPWLRVLDLSGAERLDDSCAGVLAALRSLQVLNLNYTAIGDATLGALTYGARVWSWSRNHSVPPPSEAASWPELSIQRWHLAGTRVTAAGVALLADTAQLHFLDVRAAGVPRASLRALENRFGLTLVQGAVLATSNALAAALVNHPENLACTCSATDLAAMGLPTTSAAVMARTRRREQAQRLRAKRCSPAVDCIVSLRQTGGDLQLSGPGGTVAQASGGARDGAALGVLPPAARIVNGEVDDGVAGADWMQQWATRGILEMVSASDELLRLEAQWNLRGWG